MIPDYNVSSPMFAHLVNVYYNRFNSNGGGGVDALEWALEGLSDNREKEYYYNPRHQARFLAAIKYVRELTKESLAFVEAMNRKLVNRSSENLRRCAIAGQLLEDIDSFIFSLAVKRSAKTAGAMDELEEETESMIDTSEETESIREFDNIESELEAMSQSAVQDTHILHQPEAPKSL